MSTKENIDDSILKPAKNINSNSVVPEDKNVSNAITIFKEYHKKSEEDKVSFSKKIQSLYEENRKLKEKLEEINNLINNPQKFNNDTINYVKLLQSHKELQENFNSLSSQRQKIEQQLEEKTKETDSLSQNIENNVQSIKAKENVIKQLEEINSNLKEQASKYQFALGAATTYQLGDDDKNNSVSLNEDIVHLQDTLEDYVTSLRSKTEINYKKVNCLFAKYQCNLEMKPRIKDLTLIKALLQRHVVETIYEGAAKYFKHLDHKNIKDTDEPQLLESEIDFKVSELINLMDKFTKTRLGIDNVTSAVPIKIRQQVSAALSNHGFSDIIDHKQEKNEHNFITQFKKKLNQEMESYRKIMDPKKKNGIEEKAADIIREVVRLFFFRFKTQEPIAKWKWFNHNDKFDPIQMTGSWDDDDVEDITVEICIFPLIYKDSNSSSSKLQIYTPAKVFVRDNYNSSSSSSEEEKSKKSKTKKSDKNSVFKNTWQKFKDHLK